jgi:hypothetical protein
MPARIEYHSSCGAEAGCRIAGAIGPVNGMADHGNDGDAQGARGSSSRPSGAQQKDGYTKAIHRLRWGMGGGAVYLCPIGQGHCASTSPLKDEGNPDKPCMPHLLQLRYHIDIMCIIGWIHVSHQGDSAI